jgi:hypothetical protein
MQMRRHVRAISNVLHHGDATPAIVDGTPVTAVGHKRAADKRLRIDLGAS